MFKQLKERFEAHLETRLKAECGTSEPVLWEMVRYHFGWHAPDQQRGKRLRPLIHMLATAALGQDINLSLDSAAALETFHNFTLVHDDIQDNGEYRQGRLAMWKKFGMEQAINTGDFMAYASFFLLNQNDAPMPLSPAVKLQLARAFTRDGMDVMRGQHLDMLFEGRDAIEIEDYLQMIIYKTSRLFSLAFEMAGLINQVEQEQLDQLKEIGQNIGIGFQIQDDYLGIWGDPQKTGKSVSTDLSTKKKTFPVVNALSHNAGFRKLWNQPAPLNEETIEQLTLLLEKDGLDSLTKKSALSYKEKALSNFDKVFTKENPEKTALRQILDRMIAN